MTAAAAWSACRQRARTLAAHSSGVARPVTAPQRCAALASSPGNSTHSSLRQPQPTTQAHAFAATAAIADAQRHGSTFYDLYRIFAMRIFRSSLLVDN